MEEERAKLARFKELFERRHEIAPILARHGIELDLEAVTDAERRLVRAAHRHRRPSTAMRTAHRLEETLDHLERWLEHAAPRA